MSIIKVAKGLVLWRGEGAEPLRFFYLLEGHRPVARKPKSPPKDTIEAIQMGWHEEYKDAHR